MSSGGWGRMNRIYSLRILGLRLEKSKVTQAASVRSPLGRFPQVRRCTGHGRLAFFGRGNKKTRNVAGFVWLYGHNRDLLYVLRRRVATPSKPRPASNIAYVSGSGTALTSATLMLKFRGSKKPKLWSDT